MKTRDIGRLIFLLVCGTSLWCTAVIASASEGKATQVIKLWPKDAASQGTQGMGPPSPIVAMDIYASPTLRRLRYAISPLPIEKNLRPQSSYVREEDM